MPFPSYDDRLIVIFDSYCKEVSRNYIKDLVRKNDRRGKYVSHEPVDYLLELLGHEDAYLSHAFMLEVDGYVCMVENETLYHALSSLKERQRKVLLLGFWCSFTDGEQFRLPPFYHHRCRFREPALLRPAVFASKGKYHGTAFPLHAESYSLLSPHDGRRDGRVL